MHIPFCLILLEDYMAVSCSRKRSMLVIPKVRPEDSGKYECRGTGVQTGHVAITSAQVIVNSKPDNSKYNNNRKIFLNLFEA